MTKVEETFHSFICQCDHSIRVVYHFIGVVDLYTFLQCHFIMFAQVVKIGQGITRPWSPWPVLVVNSCSKRSMCNNSVSSRVSSAIKSAQIQFVLFLQLQPS